MKGKIISRNTLLGLIIITISFICYSPLIAEEHDKKEEVKKESAGDISEEIIESESGFYYTIKEGDTLWGLSQRFSDSPFLWPDLWSENSQIRNPHRIYPGQKIRLYLKKGRERHTTVPKKEPIPEVEPEVVEEPVEVSTPVEIEEPEVEPEPPKITEYFRYNMIDMVGFIREKAVLPHGVIFKVKKSSRLISENDIIYIRQQNEGILLPGSRFTIYRTLKPVRDKKTKKYYGIQHFILGIAEVNQSAPEFAVAKVIKSFRSIQVDDLVMPYLRRPIKIPKLESQPGLTGKIIMAEEHNNIIGDHINVFIDKGEKDGVKPGQSYTIYRQETGRLKSYSRKKYLLNQVLLGRVMVLHTEATTSTVVVTKAEKDISPGQSIGTLW